MKNVYTVAQINAYIRSLVSEDVLLSSVFVKGEVSNLKYHPSGHVYFSLKDGAAALSCVLFRSMRSGLAFRMENGDRIVAAGSIDVYERDGRCQLYVREVRKEGAGELYEAYLKKKQELEEAGMFDPRYKKKIGKYNMTVGIVTASTGAAIRDIETVARRRNPYVRLILYPAIVQGASAAASIAAGIEAIDRLHPDVMIVGRGGGSIEDLWAFNEEIVARAIFASRTPVVSAVGHESDVTIADFVADLRAPTPSAAAELCVFEYSAFERQCETYMRRLNKAAEKEIGLRKIRAERMAQRFERLSPERKIRDLRMTQDLLLRRFTDELSQRIRDSRNAADMYRKRADSALKTKVSDRKNSLRVHAARLDGLSPLKRLTQGYTYTEGPDGHAVRNTGRIRQGDMLRTYVSDGVIQSCVTETGGFARALRETGERNADGSCG